MVESVLDRLSPELLPLLVPLSLFQGRVSIGHLEGMARGVDATRTRSQVECLFQTLCDAGLAAEWEGPIYQIHPFLTEHLRTRALRRSYEEEREIWVRSFTRTMAMFATDRLLHPLYAEYDPFRLFEAAFHRARQEAQRLEMATELGILTEALAGHTQDEGNYEAARQLYEGLTAEARKNRRAAEEAALTDRLGRVEEDRKDYPAAEQWYLKACALWSELGAEEKLPPLYRRLGRMSRKLRSHSEALEWHRKALAVAREVGDPLEAAEAYDAWASMANLTDADLLHRKALALREQAGNESQLLTSYWNLARVARDLRDHEAEEYWYLKTLPIHQARGDERYMEFTYRRLGMAAFGRKDFAAAEAWYLQCLEMDLQMGGDSFSSLACPMLAALAREQARYLEAGMWLIRYVRARGELDGTYETDLAMKQFHRCLWEAPEGERQELKALCAEAELGPLPFWMELPLKDQPQRFT